MSDDEILAVMADRGCYACRGTGSDRSDACGSDLACGRCGGQGATRYDLLQALRAIGYLLIDVREALLRLTEDNDGR